METEVGLPRACIKKLIKEVGTSTLKPSLTELVPIMTELAESFIETLSAQSNDICLREGRRTIMPDHVFKALEALNLGADLRELKQYNDELTQSQMNRPNSKLKLKRQGLSVEELTEMQEKLFAEAQNQFGLTDTAEKVVEDNEDYD
mmetsp:Transcript_9832/g.19441  ORF Transcript_9832/g.19441 Transcript_9832/m.19441 type:complete len:147 (-) Transcript_9832:1122-1562(-)